MPQVHELRQDCRKESDQQHTTRMRTPLQAQERTEHHASEKVNRERKGDRNGVSIHSWSRSLQVHEGLEEAKRPFDRGHESLCVLVAFDGTQSMPQQRNSPS